MKSTLVVLDALQCKSESVSEFFLFRIPAKALFEHKGLARRYEGSNGPDDPFAKIPTWRRPDKQQIKNIVDNVGRRGRGHTDPFIAVDLIVERLAGGKHDRQVFTYINDVENEDGDVRFLVGLTTKESVWSAMKYRGRSYFCSDSTWRNLNDNKAPVEFIVIGNDAQHMVPGERFLSF